MKLNKARGVSKPLFHFDITPLYKVLLTKILFYQKSNTKKTVKHLWQNIEFTVMESKWRTEKSTSTKLRQTILLSSGVMCAIC